jgi:uncharacterized tellurite resistance protein B-like protein
MLESLRHFIAELTSADGHDQRAFADDDYRLAAAGLFVHLISIDGKPSDAETKELHLLLEQRFELDPGTADRLIEAATQVEGEMVDLYHYTSRLMRALDERGRARIVEMMWQLVYADNRVSEFEESVVWRAADLLGISSTERIALKRRVAGARLAPDAAN